MGDVDMTVGRLTRRRANREYFADRLEARFGQDARLRRILASADLTAIVISGLLVIATGGSSRGALVLVLSAPAWVVFAKLLGLYDRDRQSLRHLTVDELPWLFAWAFVGGTFLALVVLPFPSLAVDSDDRLRRLGLIVAVGFTLRAVVRALWRRFTPPERVLIVGDGPVADAVVRKLELFPDIHATVDRRIGECELLADDPSAVAGVDRVIVACSQLNEEVIASLLPVCRLRGVKLTVVPPTRGMFGTATHLGHVADLPLLEYNTWDVSRATSLVKRVFDIVASLVGLLVLSPLFFLAALAIACSSGFPVFFRQTRGGKDGRPFTMLKFRTMVRDAESKLPELVPFDSLADPMFKLEKDPRVTRVGRILRSTSIDELPQLVNVLRGEMSIVGPRPEQLDLVERYAPEHRFRLSVKPGITGPMQVYGRGDLTFHERLAVEREYIENLSIVRDLRIVMLTLPTVFSGRGAF